MTNIELPGDSGDYHLLEKGIELSALVPGISCEIGLRRGGGSRHIMDAIARYCNGRMHIAIDPYGNIEYEHKEGEIVRLDYDNAMRDDCLSNLYRFVRTYGYNFQFFNLEDTEFFNRYWDGVPVYSSQKQLINKYAFVHFDGPHAVGPLKAEIAFFMNRCEPGACWVFDDVRGYYDHDVIEEQVFELGFQLIQKTYHKALYQYAP